MPTRVTGMISGMDTESLIQDLVKARGTKVEKLKKNKTKMTWKQEKWNDLNKKLKNLQSSINNLRWSSSYLKKKTASSNEGAVSVITGEGAMNSVQTLSVRNLATSGYLTGAKMETADGSAVTGETLVKDLVMKDDKGKVIEGLGISGTGSFTVTVKGESKTIEIDETTTIESLTRELNQAGVNANFDSKNGRLFIGAKSSGTEADFIITADNQTGSAAMSLLGINAKPASADPTAKQNQKLSGYYEKYSKMTTEEAVADITKDVNSDIYKMLKAELVDDEDTDYDTAYSKLLSKLQAGDAAHKASEAGYNKGAVRLIGEDAEIELNGATFTSSTNNIEVNGLTITCHALAENVTLTTEDDTDGIYDMLKNFISEYNKIINELDSLYNAEAIKGYEPLSDEEKDAMSETEATKYEDKIKGALFRKDMTMGLIFNGLKETMLQGYEVGGNKMYLSDFGINTLDYFTASQYEKSAYHIDGDSADSNTSGNADKLKSMIASDPETVVSFFTGLAASLYDKMNSLSAATESSSFGSFYDDKSMKTDLADFETKITDAEQKLNAYEDKFYAKFAAMEKALAKMNSSQSALSGLFTQ